MRWSPRIDRALSTAAVAHDGQRRKATSEPFLTHPVAVAVIVSEYTDDEDVVVAALLHDVLEEILLDRFEEDILAIDFGPRVVDLIREVTESEGAEREWVPWRERKQDFLDRLERADEGAVLIVAAEKTHNIMSLLGEHARQGDELWDRFTADPGEKLWYFRRVADVVARRLGDVPASQRLHATVDELDRVAAAHAV